MRSPRGNFGKIARALTSPRLNPLLSAQLTAGLVQECLEAELHGAPAERVARVCTTFLNPGRLQTFLQLKLQLVQNSLLFFIEVGDASQPDLAPFDRWQHDDKAIEPAVRDAGYRPIRR